ncbi:MAG: Gfo/Idh/MocA family oxidoreductase, partial [Bryobacterales bacterium]|nr:Gfo/Idh/MocA family oxidoreductase [Bryobacterales bacterium]
MIKKDPPARRAYPLRIGIAGAGFAARFHYDSLPPLMASLHGVYSPRPSSRESYAAARKTRAFASIDELLDHVDVLDVCSPPSSHADYIVAAARKGKDVIVEKP